MSAVDGEFGLNWVTFGWDEPADDAEWLRWWLPAPTTVSREEMGMPCAYLPREWLDDRNDELTVQAVGVCGACSSRQSCLQWALVTRQRFEVWGGLTARERDDLWDAR